MSFPGEIWRQVKRICFDSDWPFLLTLRVAFDSLLSDERLIRGRVGQVRRPAAMERVRRTLRTA
jgi:hypothetical protein